MTESQKCTLQLFATHVGGTLARALRAAADAGVRLGGVEAGSALLAQRTLEEAARTGRVGEVAVFVDDLGEARHIVARVAGELLRLGLAEASAELAAQTAAMHLPRALRSAVVKKDD